MSEPLYAAFLGTWVLDPRTCDYQQGEPPQSAAITIAEDSGELHFHHASVESSGESNELSFSGPANGKAMPFAGGDSVDALAIIAVSARELNSSGFYRGRERMLAQRQLDESGNAMRVTQLVRFEDGGFLANVGIYMRRILN